MNAVKSVMKTFYRLLESSLLIFPADFFANKQLLSTDYEELLKN